MTDRDRLIELLKQAQGKYCDICAECAEDLGYKDHETFEDFFADHLLANGVIVPPCKVGDVVYFLDAICVDDGYCINNCCCIDCKYSELQVCEIDFDLSMYKELGKTVFLTKEDAEKKLRELGK